MLKSQAPILRFESERLQLKYVAKWFKAGAHNNNVSSIYARVAQLVRAFAF